MVHELIWNYQKLNFEPLINNGLPSIGNVLKPIAKSVLRPLRLTETTTATDTAIHKKMFGSGMHTSYIAKRTTLIISNEEMNDIMKIVKSVEESCLLTNSLSEAIKNEAKKQKGTFLGMLLGNLGASLLGYLLTGKGTIRAS